MLNKRQRKSLTSLDRITLVVLISIVHFSFIQWRLCSVLQFKRGLTYHFDNWLFNAILCFIDKCIGLFQSVSSWQYISKLGKYWFRLWYETLGRSPSHISWLLYMFWLVKSSSSHSINVVTSPIGSPVMTGGRDSLNCKNRSVAYDRPDYSTWTLKVCLWIQKKCYIL